MIIMFPSLMEAIIELLICKWTGCIKLYKTWILSEKQEM